MRWLPALIVVPVVACSSASGQPGQNDIDPEEAPTAAAAEEASQVRARRVEVATLERSEARIELELPGEVEGSREAVLASALGGFIEQVRVQAGDNVTRGQILVLVDASTHQARMAQARVEVDAAERERDRARRLGDAIPSAQRDAADSRHAAARAAHRLARVAVSRSVIKAPFDGVIADMEAEVGEIAIPGAPMLRLVHLETVKVSISVSDRDVVALREGMAAEVHTDAQSAQHAGVLARINPAADLRTRAFAVDVEVENPDRLLLPGMIARVRLSEAVQSDQLLIPSDWVVTKPEGLGVFVVDGATAHFRSVALGAIVGNQVVITSGLETGDRLIVTGHRELVDQDPVMVVRSGTCCTHGRAVY